MRNRLLAFAIAASVAATGTAFADLTSDFKVLKKSYEELARKRDPDSNRARRQVILRMFDTRTVKSCRKLLRDAYDDERWIDNRVAVVHVYAGSGDSKAVSNLVDNFKKEKARAPVIALGVGLGFTPDANRASASASALKALKRAKEPDLRISLIEGVGEIAHEGALPGLRSLLKSDSPEERFEIALALGRCGGVDAIEDLVALNDDAYSEVRLGAVLGLAATESDEGWEILKNRLNDPDPLVVRAAAEALQWSGRKDAAPALAASMAGAGTLRSFETLRQALKELTGKDAGHDAAAWAEVAAGKIAKGDSPRLPQFAGLDVASDAVAVLVDTSGSMDWNGRLERARELAAQYVESLPKDASFALYDASRTIDRFSEGWSAGTAKRAEGAEWLRKRLTRRSLDLKTALQTAVDELPGLDTIVIATDSHPWGTGRAETSRETMEVFRRLNRTRQIRLVIALVTPGGRYEPSETSESEWLERIDYLTEMAEVSGGQFVHILE